MHDLLPQGSQNMHVHEVSNKNNNTSDSRVLQVEPLATCLTSADRIGSLKFKNDDVQKEPHDVCRQGSACSPDGARTRGADEHVACSCKR